MFQENKASQIFRKTNISYPLIRTGTCVFQGVGNVRSSESLACFVFLKYPFWDSRFWLIIDELKVENLTGQFIWNSDPLFQYFWSTSIYSIPKVEVPMAKTLRKCWIKSLERTCSSLSYLKSIHSLWRK